LRCLSPSFTQHDATARAAAFFIVSIYLISNAYENLSVMTGFPFGHYHYTSSYQIFHVPFWIGLFYISIGYLSWQTAIALIGRNADPRGALLVMLPAIAAAIMTMFDLTSDPTASTIFHIWVWEQGGAFFGVPLTNFLGWWLTTYTFFQIFALYLHKRCISEAVKPRSFALQPILLYLNLGLVSLSRLLIDSGDAIVTAMNGVSWHQVDIYEASATVFLFTMAVIAAIAIWQSYQSA
jgi:uncharacterized membrane protein